jgi:hypothetical protein
MRLGKPHLEQDRVGIYDVTRIDSGWLHEIHGDVNSR